MHKKKLIVCDDQAIFRELTASYLSLKGWEVYRASSGEECLRLAQEHDVEAILLDIHMPGIGGYETVKKLHELNLKAEIILMTGFIPESEKALAEEVKADSVLLKPFDLRSLQEMLMANMKNHGEKSETISKRVLVVDDEDLLRDMLSMFIKKNGFEVVVARDGKECVAKASQEKFLAIFMDIRMPNMDGVSALRSLRSSGIDTPVILMSGFCELTTVDEAKSNGALAFLAKPFKPAKAVEILQTEVIKPAAA